MKSKKQEAKVELAGKLLIRLVGQAEWFIELTQSTTRKLNQCGEFKKE